jgi:hypothetical protein
MVDDELSEDYISAAAGVVDAARNLDEANRKSAEATKAATAAHVEKMKAEKALQAALDKLKHADTGRK